MGIIFFGNKETPIGLDEFLIKCPSCETHSWADIMVLSNYYHIYWVPMFPFEKNANVICKKCGLKRYGRSFDASLISNYNEVKNNFRHPWFTYAGAGTLTIIFIAIILASVL
jgi:hypothetical protein